MRSCLSQSGCLCQLFVLPAGIFWRQHPDSVNPKNGPKREPHQRQDTEDETEESRPRLPLEESPSQDKVSHAKESKNEKDGIPGLAMPQRPCPQSRRTEIRRHEIPAGTIEPQDQHEAENPVHNPQCGKTMDVAADAILRLGHGGGASIGSRRRCYALSTG